MTSILFLIQAIQRKIFDAFMSKTKRFISIYCEILKSASNLEHFQKKMTLLAYLFPKLPTPNDVVR